MSIVSVVKSHKKYESKVRVLVAGFFMDRNKTDTWMITANPLLGGISPVTMILLGRGKRLLEFVQNQLAENRPGD